MADIVLFHHALGLTPGCLELAAMLRTAGHTVVTPDLYDGEVFASLSDGVAHLERAGFDTIVQRGCDAVTEPPERLVYIGISLGVMPAQRLAQTRPGAAGAVFLEACAPVDAFADGWPAGVPVQIHGMDGDEFFAGEGDLDHARRLVAEAAPTAAAELFTYPGEAHLFVDGSTPGHDPEAAALVVSRLLELLGRIDDEAGTES